MPTESKDYNQRRTPKPLKKFVQLTELEKTKGWFFPDKGVVIPFEALTIPQLREALREAEARELRYYNKSAFFAQMAEKLTAETEKRGLEPEHYNTEFTMNSRNIKIERDEQQA